MCLLIYKVLCFPDSCMPNVVDATALRLHVCPISLLISGHIDKVYYWEDRI
jgi:hypothetical protein